MEAVVLKGLKQIQSLLKLTFGLVPIIAGLDKFTNLLTDWTVYLNPMILHIIPVEAHTFMMMVGVIEIVAGIIVLVRPDTGAYIVSAWLVLIALSLIGVGKYFDVAVRDLVMAIGSFVLARLSHLLKLDIRVH